MGCAPVSADEEDALVFLKQPTNGAQRASGSAAAGKGSGTAAARLVESRRAQQGACLRSNG